MMRRFLAGLAILAGALLLSTSPVAAATDGVKLGPVQAFPALTITETYEDNIFLASDDSATDWITTVRPSLRLALPLQRFLLQAQGEVGAVLFADHDDENATNWGAGGTFGAEFPGGLSFEVGDAFRRQYLTATQEFGEGEESSHNVARAKVGFAIRNAFRLEVAFFNNIFRYDRSKDRERDENDLQVDFFWRFLPKTSALVELAYDDYAYKSNTAQDNTALKTALGLTWDITSRSIGIVKAGYEWKSFQDENDALGYENGGYYVLTANMRHFFDKRTTGELEIGRASRESDFSDNPYYLRTSVGANVGRRFTHKLYGRLGLRLHRDAYPHETAYLSETGDRTDNVVHGDAALGFDILRWLNLELSYAGERRSSTFDVFEYTDNKASLAVKATF